MSITVFIFFFFFSSRRRHTRYIGDWSSDVCSSDLCSCRTTSARLRPGRRRPTRARPGRATVDGRAARRSAATPSEKIGRAAWRERVEGWEVAGGVKKKKEQARKTATGSLVAA